MVAATTQCHPPWIPVLSPQDRFTLPFGGIHPVSWNNQKIQRFPPNEYSVSPIAFRGHSIYESRQTSATVAISK
jgi:hypothetical protein